MSSRRQSFFLVIRRPPRSTLLPTTTLSRSSVELRATDMEVGLRVPLEAKIEREGTPVLPARLTLDVIRALPARDVTVELRADRKSTRLNTSHANIPYTAIYLKK